jgi:ankyrin repeat protein
MRKEFERTDKMIFFSHLGNKIGIEEYLNLGLDIETLDNKGMSILHWSIVMENSYLMSFLVNNGADVNVIVEKSFDSPASLAIRYGNVPILNFILEHGGDINYQNHEKRDLLSICAESGSVLCLEYLVYVNIEIKNCYFSCTKMLHVEQILREILLYTLLHFMETPTV